MFEVITPHFQPIISVYDGKIYGYEVLGRYLENNQYKSLGAFFMDDTISNEEKIEVDRRIRKKALEKFKVLLDNYEKDSEQPKLFINVNPSWILNHKDDTIDFPTISYLKELGISGEHIVIEITEHQFNNEIEILNKMLDQYRQYGCGIAVDDFSFEDFDRLIDFRPQIVKIDRKLIIQSTKRKEYCQLLNHISRFAEELGIGVLFEGVETLEETEMSIELGSRLLQGFRFSKAQIDFQKIDQYRMDISELLERVVSKKYKSAKSVMLMEKELDRLLNEDIKHYLRQFEVKQPDILLESILDKMPYQCKRLFICKSSGQQISSNYTKLNGDMHYSKQPEYKYKNWGWRPYFLYNMIRTQHLKRGIISFKYKDMKSKWDVRTFSFHLKDDYFMFLDIEIEN